MPSLATSSASTASSICSVRPLPPLPPAAPPFQRRNTSPTQSCQNPRPLPSIPKAPHFSPCGSGSSDLHSLQTSTRPCLDGSPSSSRSESPSYPSSCPSASSSSASSLNEVSPLEESSPDSPLEISWKAPSSDNKSGTKAKLSVQTSSAALQTLSEKYLPTPTSPMVYSIPSPRRRRNSRLQRRLDESMSIPENAPGLATAVTRSHRRNGMFLPRKAIEDDDEWEDVPLSAPPPCTKTNESWPRDILTRFSAPFSHNTPESEVEQDVQLMSCSSSTRKGYSVSAKRRSAKWIRIKRGRQVESDYADIISALRQL